MAYGFLTAISRRGTALAIPGAGCGGPAAQARAPARAPWEADQGERAWDFAFATGIECSNPTVAGSDGRGLRRDLLAECGHYERWREDLALVADLRIPCLRYGLPIHRVWLGVDRYDWGFADLAMDEIRRLGITPILDLLHFGVPDWIGDCQNPDLPVLFAAYAGAVAERYPWVRFFTPVNEIYVCARNSGQDGLWNERLRSDTGFVTALKHLVAANLLANAAIERVRADAVIIQSESAEYTHHVRASPAHDIKLRNKLVFTSLDLLYAKSPDADVLMFLMDSGMTRDEFLWFMRTPAVGFQVMGNDYYGRNEHIVLPDGSVHEGEDVLGWYLITLRYFRRYYKPVMHTETNVFDPASAPMWLWKQWVNVLRMRRDGIPVLGFTWYSLIDQMDWDIQLAEPRQRVNACGLFDLDRRPRPVASAYRDLLREFGDITALAHGEMFELTKRESSERSLV
ncbi:MAG TPA: family 1 glycosylhydrolase [Planctomycetota bacterium]|nr:family 1 glycosylhydrolase [Planctomycetota bacterium]